MNTSHSTKGGMRRWVYSTREYRGIIKFRGLFLPRMLWAYATYSVLLGWVDVIGLAELIAELRYRVKRLIYLADLTHK